MASHLRLLTLDADDTLYPAGTSQIEEGLLSALVYLLTVFDSMHLAVVTAAGYPGKPARYEERFQQLLEQCYRPAGT